MRRRINDVELEELRKLYVVDGLSCTKAALAFNRMKADLIQAGEIGALTRSAVTGYANRRGWNKGRDFTAPPTPAKPRRAAPRKPPPAPDPDGPPAGDGYQAHYREPPATAMRLMDMPGTGANLCRMPVGFTPEDMSDQLFCAAPAEGVYCASCLNGPKPPYYVAKRGKS